MDFSVSTCPVLPTQGVQRRSTCFTDPRQVERVAAAGITGKGQPGAPRSPGGPGRSWVQSQCCLVTFEDAQPGLSVSRFGFPSGQRPAQTGGLITHC